MGKLDRQSAVHSSTTLHTREVERSQHRSSAQTDSQTDGRTTPSSMSGRPASRPIESRVLLGSQHMARAYILSRRSAWYTVVVPGCSGIRHSTKFRGRQGVCGSHGRAAGSLQECTQRVGGQTSGPSFVRAPRFMIAVEYESWYSTSLEWPERSKVSLHWGSTTVPVRMERTGEVATK